MYVLPAFRIEDLPELHGFMRQYPFATLVSGAPPDATHLPITLDPSRGELGTLLGHVARGNRQWETLESAGEVLVIFHGPHAYVSPTWYETQLAVPTWNYAAVHVYGRVRLQDEAELRSTLEQLARTFEDGRPQPWSLDSVPDDWLEKLMRGIVGFEVEITRLQGKYKLGQNRSAADQEGVLAALSASSHPEDRALAAFQAARLNRD